MMAASPLAGGGGGEPVLLAGAGAAEAGLPGGDGRGDRLHVHLCAGVDHVDAAHRYGALRPVCSACAGRASQGDPASAEPQVLLQT